jgi:hypothetical protein
MELQLENRKISQMSRVQYSTQRVIEILNMNCFNDIKRSGYIYYCNRLGAKEIMFRELFGGNHVFYVNKEHCHDVYKAIEWAVAK